MSDDMIRMCKNTEGSMVLKQEGDIIHQINKV